MGSTSDGPATSLQGRPFDPDLVSLETGNRTASEPDAKRLRFYLARRNCNRDLTHVSLEPQLKDILILLRSDPESCRASIGNEHC